MAGSTDLAAMLAGLEVDRVEGTFVYVTIPPGVVPPMGLVAAATVSEAEGTTLVVDHDDAERHGLISELAMAWLTLRVHSSLAAVGLTAAVSAALAAEGIPANVIAGYFHDHVLVPAADADRAVGALRTLARDARAGP